MKISNKKKVEDLQAKLMLHLGRKITQQETLDLCIETAEIHIEDLIAKANQIPQLTPDRAEEIINDFEIFKGTHYDPKAKFESEYDNDIYSL